MIYNQFQSNKYYPSTYFLFQLNIALSSAASNQTSAFLSLIFWVQSTKQVVCVSVACPAGAWFPDASPGN
jgi:hypothetical protein